VRLSTVVVLAAVVAVLAACGSTPARPRTGASPAAADAAGFGSVAGDPSVSASAATSASAGASARATGCSVFPANNVWHADVSRLPVHASSAAWVASIGTTKPGHPDFGAGFGMPVTTVPAGTPTTRVTFQYARESDPGPYPVPRTVKVEGGASSTGDRHVLLFDPAACRAYELYAAYPNADGTWRAGSGAIFDLRGNALRPAGWTSADAAGLSVLAGLVRYEEVAAGRVDHAVRFTAPRTRNSYLWPARHEAGSADAALPPMGARFRLKASVDTSRFPAQARVVAEALKRYGAILADNGSSWFFSGTDDSRWSNSALDALKTLRGSDFEAVDASGLMASPNSAAVRG
jgi:hypothetical protein